MTFDGIDRGIFHLRPCATTRRFCVVCARTTDKLCAQVFVVRHERERFTNAVICPDCLKDLPTFDEWRRLHDQVDAWDSHPERWSSVNR